MPERHRAAEAVQQGNCRLSENNDLMQPYSLPMSDLSYGPSHSSCFKVAVNGVNRGRNVWFHLCATGRVVKPFHLSAQLGAWLNSLGDKVVGRERQEGPEKRCQGTTLCDPKSIFPVF